MYSVQESAAVKPFPSKPIGAGTALKSDFGVVYQRRNDGGLTVPSRNSFTRKTTSGCCPCCGAALQNQQAIVDLNSNTFLFRDAAIALSPKEAEMLSVLLRRSPGVVTRDTLISAMWGGDEPDTADKALMVYVCRLRKRLRGLGVSIINVLDVGYRISIGEGA